MYGRLLRRRCTEINTKTQRADCPSMARFTSANAREMAAKSLAARQAAKIERDAPPTPAVVQAGSNGDQTLGIDASRVRVRLEKLDSLMGQAKTDREWDNLTCAFDRLFRVWCTLTRTPGPGNLKLGSPRTQQRRFMGEPVPVAPRPMSCGP